MKALSIRQPWANLIASGKKTIETRTWQTTYRGPLLIVAGKSIDIAACHQFPHEPYDPRGVALAIVELYDIKTMAVEHERAAMTDARPVLFAWYIRDVRAIRPFPVKGMLGIFEVKSPLLERGKAIMKGDL